MHDPIIKSTQARLALTSIVRTTARAAALQKKVLTRASCLFVHAIIAVLLSSCATTSIKSTWKSPDFNGAPVQKVAVLAVAERVSVRTALEHRFANQLGKAGQAA